MLATQANTSPFRRKDAQKSPVSDLENLALQCRKLAAMSYKVILKWGLCL